MFHRNGLQPKDVVFDTQMYFLSNRYKATLESLDYDGLIIKDRSDYEDICFPYGQIMNKKEEMWSPMQLDIYIYFFESYLKTLPKPKFWIYFKVSPETAFKSLQERIKQRESQGLDTQGEKLIDEEYMKNLAMVYEEWAMKMKETFGDRFIIIDYDTFKPFEEILQIIEKNL